LALFLSSAILCQAQTPDRPLSKDSVKYYQRELNKLWRSNYDSLRNSDRYKEITEKLKTKNRAKVATVELLANIGLYFTDFKNLNERLKASGHEEIKKMVPSFGASLAVGSQL
jgi:hypothetical protein